MLTKFILIFGAIILLIILGLNYLKNKIRKIMFGNIDPKNGKFASFNNFNQTRREKESDDEVVYKKDDTVILKGEAKSKKK